MSFTSLKYVAFFFVAAGGWYLLPLRLRRFWLLAAGFVFYAFAGVRYLPFLLGAAIIAYAAALAADTELLGKRSLWITLGIIILLGALFICKYTGFLLGSFAPQLRAPNIPLPPGLSFYCFGASAYLIDVKRGKLRAEHSFADVATFLAFFPVLLAGPVGRAREFLPQLKTPPSFDASGCRAGAMRFVRGACKKLIAADSLGLLVDKAYADPSAVSGGAMLVAVLAYSLQIYWDFSAYSDMAIGCAEMLGLHVTENFRAPYLSRSVKEFWKKWHISLTDWFREYLYIPLGGSRKGKTRTALNVLIVFAVSGAWHGAAWTFIIWGLLNGAFQVVGDRTQPLRRALRGRIRMAEDSPVCIAWQGIVTFLLLTVAWIFFRAEGLPQAVYVIKHILLIVRDGFGMASAAGLLEPRRWLLLAVCLAFCIWEDVRISRGLRPAADASAGFRYWGTLALLCFALALFGLYGQGFDAQEFVYFRF